MLNLNFFTLNSMIWLFSSKNSYCFNMPNQRKFITNGVIHGAMHLRGFNPDSPNMLGFKDQIMAIIGMYSPEYREDIESMDVLGTNYVIRFTKSGPVLMYKICSHNIADTNCFRIGKIITPDFNIPDPSKAVVVQKCPGIVNIYLWKKIREKLRSATVASMEPHDFVQKVVRDVIRRIGYVSNLDARKSFESQVELMANLKALFNQEQVEHETNHMNTICELVSELECEVM